MTKCAGVRRKVVSVSTDAAPNHVWLTLSCGHGYQVSAFGRYAAARTLGCRKCTEEQHTQ